MASRILVTGATGYIGGRLVPELLAGGHAVRCLARTPAKLGGQPWRRDVEIAKGDASDPSALATAMSGRDAAYYLLHSMAGLRRRRVVPIPVLSPRLSSLWVGLVTPIPPGLARPLIDSLVNEVTVGDRSTLRVEALVPERLVRLRAEMRLLGTTPGWNGRSSPSLTGGAHG